MRFMQYLKEVQQTKRQDIKHLEKMSPLEFLRLARMIIKEKGGKLEEIPVSLKVDGFGARFGKDEDGKFFFETSRSGPIQSRGAFSAFHANRGTTDNEVISRAKHFDELYDKLEDSPIWHHLPKDTKVVCEILYNPLATFTEDGGAKFVSVKYDKAKLGTLMTIVPLKIERASDGSDVVEAPIIFRAMLNLSTNEIKVVDPHLGRLSVDVSAALQPLSLLNDEVFEILKSLKHKDRDARKEYEALIQKVKDDIAAQLLREPIQDKDKLGSDIEGLVLRIGDHMVKVTTPEFKDSKRKV